MFFRSSLDYLYYKEKHFHLTMYKVLNTLLARKEDWDDHGGVTTCVSLLPQIWKTFKSLPSILLWQSWQVVTNGKIEVVITLKMEFAPLSEGKKIFGQDQKESEFNTNSGDEVLRTLEMSNQIVKHLGPILNSLEGVESKLGRIIKKVESYIPIGLHMRYVYNYPQSLQSVFRLFRVYVRYIVVIVM